ncbi:lebercilin-like protein isoform X1 [Neopelma chrysocephalum]|uniref:lebercilin-like protein isoform X1 n=1 Tax=Neopelma chrysocephalum TaxID=114329 RepID=UPI000FCD2330|nr:lebercilin-like protein isoform X1 [Neopelma chrysocephalum]
MIFSHPAEKIQGNIFPPTFPRALPVIDSGTVRGSQPLAAAGTEEKKTQKNGKKRMGNKKKGQCLFPQGDKKGGRTFPAPKTHHCSCLTLQSNVTSQDRNAAAQRISSARLHKIKELKNEIFDLQRKIEASSLENHALRQLQWRQSKAMGRYKSSESYFEDLSARHYEEVRNLRNLLRMSQESERNTSKELRKVEAELLKVKDALQALLVLSEDKGLAGREELHHRLSVLTEKLEAKDEQIQDLEMQLKLNNNTFNRQLASESKKALEAGIITQNLKMEINSLRQKIKEKDRQLYIKNIYANRMPKTLKDRIDLVPQEQSLSVNRAVQVDKESFRALLLSQHQDTEKSPIQLIKEKKSSEDKDEEAAANEVNSDAQRTENQSTKKTPVPKTSNRAHRGFMKEKEKKTELLKQELKNLMKTGQGPQSDGVKDNNQEGDAVEEFEKGEELEEQQINSGKEGKEGAIPNKTPVRPKKKYTFSEAIENLHQGLHTSGRNPKAGSQGQAGQGCTATAESRGKNSFGLYEPSFGKDTKPRQEDGAAGAEGPAHVAFAERKKQLMKELFGAGAAQRDNPSSSNMRGTRCKDAG